jgi:hypothetical protein
MQSTAEAARRAGDGFAADERLRRFVRVFMRRILLEAAPSVTHKLITRELADPTEVLDEIVQRGIRPRIEYLSSLVAEILGAPADDARVVRAVASIQAQMVFYVPNPVLERFGVRANASAREVDALADHITAFSLGGIHAIRRRGLRS